MRRSTLISCDAQGLGQGRAFKSIHMNNRKTGYVEDFFAHFLFQHQGRPKLKRKLLWRIPKLRRCRKNMKLKKFWKCDKRVKKEGKGHLYAKNDITP